MVNPINNNYPTEYQPSAGKTVKVDNEEHFSLDSALNENKRMQEGVLYESAEKKDSQNPAGHTGGSSGTGSQKKDTFESSLDKAQKQHEQIDRNNSAFNESLKSLWANVSSFFSSLWYNIKKAFGNVWESKPLAEGMESMRKEDSSAVPTSQADVPDSGKSASEAVAPKSISVSEAGDDTKSLTASSSIDALEAERDSKIRKALSDGNRDEFRSLISEDGKKLPAHNTSMLTTYDSSGKLVNIDPSDENKILHGDRGTRKL